MKYLVIEIEKAYVILLNEEGRFLRAANLNYELGQIVEDPFLMNEASKTKKRFQEEKKRNFNLSKPFYKQVMVACLCLFLLFGRKTYHYYNIEVFSQINLTINPDLEIHTNRREKVINLLGKNDDGKKLVEDYKEDSLKGKDLNQVIDELVDKSIEEGYLDDGGSIGLDLKCKETDKEKTMAKNMEESLIDSLEEKIDVDLYISIDEKDFSHRISQPEKRKKKGEIKQRQENNKFNKKDSSLESRKSQDNPDSHQDYINENIENKRKYQDQERQKWENYNIEEKKKWDKYRQEEEKKWQNHKSQEEEKWKQHEAEERAKWQKHKEEETRKWEEHHKEEAQKHNNYRQEQKERNKTHGPVENRQNSWENHHNQGRENWENEAES